jgi:hypothetical protein
MKYIKNNLLILLLFQLNYSTDIMECIKKIGATASCAYLTNIFVSRHQTVNTLRKIKEKTQNMKNNETQEVNIYIPDCRELWLYHLTPNTYIKKIKKSSFGLYLYNKENNTVADAILTAEDLETSSAYTWGCTFFTAFILLIHTDNITKSTDNIGIKIFLGLVPLLPLLRVARNG